MRRNMRMCLKDGFYADRVIYRVHYLADEISSVIATSDAACVMQLKMESKAKKSNTSLYFLLEIGTMRRRVDATVSVSSVRLKGNNDI